MSIEEKVIKIVAQVCRTGEAGITRKTEYVKDLSVTKSVTYFQVASILEAEFDVKVNFQKLRTKTVGETIDYINGLIQQTS